jgi:hypothetical protein
MSDSIASHRIAWYRIAWHRIASHFEADIKLKGQDNVYDREYIRSQKLNDDAFDTTVVAVLVCCVFVDIGCAE